LATHLPDPEWIQTLPSCPGCGYNLTGLIVPGQCPECGFAVDDKTMVLSGVVKADATQSAGRRVLWVLVFTAAFLMAYGWPFFILMRWFGCGFFLLWLGTLIGLLATSKRSRAGKMKVIIATGGFYVIDDLHSPQHEGRAVSWDHVARMQFDRISPVWYKVQLWSANNNKLLEAGVRCTDELAPLVQDTIRWRLNPDYSGSISSTTSTQIGPSGVS